MIFIWFYLFCFFSLQGQLLSIILDGILYEKDDDHCGSRSGRPGCSLKGSKGGFDVKLISSFPSERAQSVMAEGGINAALDTQKEGDSPKQHYEDTVNAGCGLADPNAVWNMTQAAPNLVRWLHRIGVQFNTCGFDEIDLRNLGGQKKKRTAFAKSDTGKQLMTA